MQYCQYHPLLPATYKCKYCRKHMCDDCVDESNCDTGEAERCFICHNDVENLGAMYKAEPFWQRLPQIMRYPLRIQTLIFIVITSCITPLLNFPLVIIWYLIFTGVFTKYCFSCLQSSADGLFTPPDIRGSVRDGLGILLKLFSIYLTLALIAIALAIFAHIILCMAFIAVVLFSFPAITINFALTESIGEAISIERNAYIIKSIGPSYALLLVIIVFLLGSVEALNLIIADHYPLFATGIQSAITSYYTIAIYHLLGYVLFQYQAKLGFTAKSEDHNKETRSGEEQALASIHVHVKEGLYQEASSLFRAAVQKHTKSKALHNQFFDFLIATKNIELLDDFSSVYFSFLVSSYSKSQLSFVYKKILMVNPKFTPKTANDKFLVAQICYSSGDALGCVRILNGIQKQFPDYIRLDDALTLLLDALRELPKMKEKAEAFELYLKRFRQKQELKALLNRDNCQIPSAPKPVTQELSLEDNTGIQPAKEFVTAPAPAINFSDTGSYKGIEVSGGVEYDGGIDFKP